MEEKYDNREKNDTYTLYLTPIGGKYMVNYVRGTVGLTEEQKNQLVRLLTENESKGPNLREDAIVYIDTGELKKVMAMQGGSRRRRRPSRKYKKSKRVFRKKSRSTRRR